MGKELGDEMNEDITKEGVKVEPGQIWHDLDRRMQRRFCRVEYLDGKKAVMRPCGEDGRMIHGSGVREVRIAIKRMHKSSSGWELTLAPDSSPRKDE